MPTDYTELPADLPEPIDDGRAAHLVGARVADLAIASTSGSDVSPAALPGRTVLYAYPRTGRPGVASPEGWDAIPGARGCTPQSCAFRDHHAELDELGAAVYGLTAQPLDEVGEAHARLHLPFPILSDPDLRFASAMRMPTFTVAGTELYARLTLVIREGRVEHVMYPVFPPDRNADDVLAWLRGTVTRRSTRG